MRTMLPVKIFSFALYLLSFVLGFGGTYSWFQRNFFNPIDAKHDRQEQIFIVQQNDTLEPIARRLEEQHLTRHWWSLYLLNKLNEDERAKHILPGEYGISAADSPKQILEKILSGKVYFHTVTIPEGTALGELPKILAGSGLVTEAEVQSTLENKNILQSLAIPSETFEGYLFPETYNFTRPTTAEEMIKKLVAEGRKQIRDHVPDFTQKALELGLSTQQIVTLASIVEKESARDEDRPLVASVLLNRLRIGYPLQSDPTVIYGIQGFDGNLTKQHLKDQNNPYNTYARAGLPPTPICSPSLASVKAVVYAADTDYLYFVARGDGTTEFSKTLKEHNEAVAKFQKGRS